jgi:hypothetical protein
MQGPAPALALRAVTRADAGWIKQHVTDRWRAETIVAHGEVFHRHELPGFIALWDGEPVSRSHTRMPAAAQRMVDHIEAP